MTPLPQEYLDQSIRFFDIPFQISEDTLIPRLETESLVRRAIQIIRHYDIKDIIDIGTGSGIIPIAVAKNTDITSMRGIDISPEALAIARNNGCTLLSDIEQEWCEGDLLSLLEQLPDNVLITANLPYIAPHEAIGEGVEHEPDLALYGGPVTGFEMYERLFEQIAGLVTPQQTFHLVIEFGHEHAPLARGEAKKYGWNCEIFSDTSGIKRFGYIT